MHQRYLVVVALVFAFAGCRDQEAPVAPATSVRVASAAFVADLPDDPTYELEDLGPLAQRWCCYDGGEASELGNFHSLLINDAGDIAGLWMPDSANPSNTLGLPFVWRDGAFTQLGAFTGVKFQFTALTANGDVVGCAPNADGQQRPMIWSRGELEDLGTLGGTSGCSTAVDNAGRIVGTSKTAAGADHAFRWTRGGGMEDLGTLGGAASKAFGTTENGASVGWAQNDSGKVRMAEWWHGEVSDLGTPDVPAGAKLAFLGARGVNNARTAIGVIGWFEPPGLFFRAGRAWIRDKKGNFTVVPPTVAGWHVSMALSINNVGRVLGQSLQIGEGGDRAVDGWTWQDGVVMRVDELLRPSGYNAGGDELPRAMNDSGVVVGVANTGPGFGRGTNRAWVSTNGVMLNLGGLGGHTAAEAINNHGDIVGVSVNPAGQPRLVRWRKRL